MIAKPDTARAEWPCPVARIWGDAKVNPNCRGDLCPVWRTLPKGADSPDFKAAVKKEVARIAEAHGSKAKPVYHSIAVSNVTTDPEAHGVMPETRGYCGLGSRP